MIGRRSPVLPAAPAVEAAPDPKAVFVVGVVNDRGVVTGLTHTTMMTRGEAALEVANSNSARSNAARRRVLCRVVIDGEESP